MKKRLSTVLLSLMLTLSVGLTGCGNAIDNKNATESSEVAEAEASDAYQLMEAVNPQDVAGVDDKYRNYYEIFPYSYCDSNGDGIGDLNGISSKLDYISDLGINAIWLTPICSSDTYHKYDVKDYYTIDPDFGTMEDFENLMSGCEDRGIDVIVDLVVNHTSTKNEWFRQAYLYIKSLDEGEEPDPAECPYVEYYNFSREYKSGWSQIADTEWYYEAQVWSEMPDLNLDNEAVRNEISDIVQFWLDKGVAGFRLDATTSYYTGSDEKNVEFLSWLNGCVKEKKADAYIVGECWSNNVTYSSYYASGVDSFFDFDFADKNGSIAKVLQGGNAVGFGNTLMTVQSAIQENNPEAIDAAFTSNHDTGRVSGYFAGDYSENMTKMAQAVAMMMGGNYFLYYGDELGMKGSGDDENKRCPMQWSTDSSAEEMCDSVATKSVEMKYGSLEEQEADGNSIYYFVKEGLKLRNAYPEIARGTTSVEASVSDENVLVLRKEYEGTELLIVMNLSEAEKTMDLSQLSVNGKAVDDTCIAGMLITGDAAVSMEESTVTMPAYSVELFR